MTRAPLRAGLVRAALVPVAPSSRARMLAGLALAGLALAGLALAGLAGCGDGAAEERRHVLARVDALRDAAGVPAADRAVLLEALRAAKAEEPLAVAARDRCAAAYGDLVEANLLEEEARAAMATGEKVDTLLLAQRLETATRLLESSRAAMPACDRALTDLRATKP